MRIAITGTIGSGKTVVSEYLRSKGYDVFDCDKTNRDLLNTRAYELLYDAFPDCFDNEVLDKKKLTDKVFSSSRKRKKLESIMHPEILKELERRTDDPLFGEVPLLFEVNWDKYFDTSWLVVTEEEIALKRLLNRGIDETEAKRRIAVQMPVEEKKSRAGQIIYNNGSLEELYAQIDKLLEELC